MSIPLLQVAVPAAATAVGALGGWFGVRRTTSGTVRTSEAEDLWEEGRQIRIELRSEVDRLHDEVIALHTQVDRLGGSLEDCLKSLRQTPRRPAATKTRGTRRGE